jgi:hypothetical protein
MDLTNHTGIFSILEEKMAENHEGGNPLKKCGEEEKCLTLPIPEDKQPGEIPEKIAEYDKIPSDKKAEIDEKKDIAYRTAKKAKDDTNLDIKDVKAEAESKYNLTNNKVKTLRRKYDSEILIEIDDLYKQYQKDLKNSLKKCTESVDPPDYIKAVAIAKYKSELAKKTKGYLDSIKDFETQESAASSAWEQAQKDYQSAKCKAIADYEEAIKVADFEYYSKLKEALDTVCN